MTWPVCSSVVFYYVRHVMVRKKKHRKKRFGRTEDIDGTLSQSSKAQHSSILIDSDDSTIAAELSQPVPPPRPRETCMLGPSWASGYYTRSLVVVVVVAPQDRTGQCFVIDPCTWVSKLVLTNSIACYCLRPCWARSSSSPHYRNPDATRAPASQPSEDWKLDTA